MLETVTPLHRIGSASALTKARLAALALACASLVPSLPADPDISVAWRVSGSAGLVLLIALYITTFVRGRTFLLDPVAVPALLVIIGSGRQDPGRRSSVCRPAGGRCSNGWSPCGYGWARNFKPWHARRCLGASRESRGTWGPPGEAQHPSTGLRSGTA